MILRNQVEWALHCCTILAALPEDKYLSTKSLAEFHGVPKEYLSKALQSLSQHNIVTTTLGPTGGYKLARPAKDINFLEVVEAIEGRTSTFKCTEIRANNPCRPKGYCDKKPCGIASIMWQADEAWRNTLRNVSLADISANVARDVPADLLNKSYEWLLSS